MCIRDSINGGPGNDFITGNDSNDILNGDTGDDRILGGSGSDVCYNSETGGTCETLQSRSPICLGLANSNGSITLSWDPVPNVDKYHVRVLDGDYVSTVDGASYWTGGSSDRRYQVRHRVQGKVVDIACENQTGQTSTAKTENNAPAGMELVWSLSLIHI